MSYRFFLEAKPDSDAVFLDGDQARHAIHVMRYQKGDEIVLFDGVGTEYSAIIDQVTKKRLSLSILESRHVDRAVDTKLTMAVAMPKGDRQKFLIEKLVELGVERFVPLKTTRSVAVANDKVLQRIQKQVIEASKQCGRNRLMRVLPEQSIQQFAESLDPQNTCLIAHPYQGKTISEHAIEDSDTGRSIAVAIGPEGGFDDNEIQSALSLGFQPIRLGPAILRVETAALAIAAILGIGKEPDASANDPD